MTRRSWNALLREGGIGLALVILIVIFSLLSPDFASLRNLRNVLNQITINTVLAIGLTFVILVGGIDLSVGSLLAFSIMITGVVMQLQSLPPGLAILLGTLCRTRRRGDQRFLERLDFRTLALTFVYRHARHVKHCAGRSSTYNRRTNALSVPTGPHRFWD